MQNILGLIAATVAIPLALLLLRALFSWRYRRMLAQAMRGSSSSIPPSLAPLDSPANSNLRIVVGKTVSGAANGQTQAQIADAAACTRQTRSAFASALLLYSSIASVTLLYAFAEEVAWDARIGTLVVMQAPLIFLAALLLSWSARTVACIAILYVCAGLAALLPLADLPRIAAIVGTAVSLFFVLPATGLALLLLRQLRPLLVAFGALLLYVAVNIVMAIVLTELELVADAPIRTHVYAITALGLICAVLIARWMLGRPSLRAPLWYLAGTLVLGLTLMVAWNPAPPLDLIVMPLLVVPSSVLQILLVWLLFRLNVWLQDRHLLPAQLLHSHVAVGFLSFYLILVLLTGSALFRSNAAPAAIALAFVAYAGVLHVLMRRIWRRQATRAGKRLLLLRAFGTTKAPERLIDALEDSWRRVGAIDLIAGEDLALRTLGARMLGAFLIRKADRQFVRRPEDVDRAVSQCRTSLEGDARYPINTLYCSADTWQAAFRKLAIAADAVLMDMRGFDSSNRGCIFELSELIAKVPLDRVLILADRSTDLSSLRSVAASAWAQLPHDSPNATDAAPELRVIELMRPRARDFEHLFGALLEAAAGQPPSS